MTQERDYDVETLIVGTGFSGLSAAHELLATDREDFLLIERAGEIGGVWRENQYPNAACDVEAHLYSLSFAQSAEWSCNFASWDEILTYMNRVVDDLGIRNRIRFGTEMVHARWDEDAQRWHVGLSGGDVIVCRFLISAVGALSLPFTPDLPGMDRYRGELVHSAHWHAGLDFTGKRIAVIGAGASAIQLVPYAVSVGTAVLTSIRTPPHVMPRPEEYYDEAQKQFFREHPEVLQDKRRELYEYWNHSTHMQAIMDEEFLAQAEATWKAHMESAVADPELRARLTPHSRFGCRRPVVSNAYYPALADPKTTVWSEPITAFTATGVVGADGREWDADAVILATGFRGTDLFAGVDYEGAGGRRLSDVWAGVPTAYKGTLVDGFPNLFLMTGPNTQASGSIIGVIEAQSRMVTSLLNLVDAGGHESLAVTPEALRRYNDDLDLHMAHSVWEAGGCSSWYRKDGDGKVVTKWPGSLADFEEVAAAVESDDFVFGHAVVGASSGCVPGD